MEHNFESSAPRDNRNCKMCGFEKPYTPEHWPSTRGKARGNVCLPCMKVYHRQRRRNLRPRVAARTQSIGELAETTLSAPARAKAVSKVESQMPVEAKLQKLNAARALSAGAGRINEQARHVLDTLFAYIDDPTSPHHEWALRLVAERVLPRKLYENLGDLAAGIKGQGTQRPEVTIIVQPATVAPEADPSPVIITGVATRSENAEESAEDD